MTNTVSEIQTTKPWYKQSWLWFIMIIPIISIILSSIMLYVAIVGRDTLVDDNYYKDGLAINQTIEQDTQSVSMKLMPHFSLVKRHITVKLESPTETIPQYAFLNLKLLHPTLENKDIELKLLPIPDNTYIGDINSEIKGKRHLDLSSFDKTWRIREAVFLPSTDLILNQAAVGSKSGRKPSHILP